MATVAIIGTSKTFSADPTRQGKTDRIILYRTEDGITRFTTIPDETYSLAAAEAAVRKAEAERVMAQPHNFTL